MPPYAPKYVDPKRAAEERARLKARLFWVAVSLPLTFAILAFGYSDQAPAFMRSAIIGADRLLGFPFAALLSALTGR